MAEQNPFSPLQGLQAPIGPNPLLKKTARPGSMMAVFGMRPTESDLNRSIQAQAMGRIAQLREQNPTANPAQLLNSFFMTPEGQAAFTDPQWANNFMALQGFLSGTVNLGENQTLHSQFGGPPIAFGAGIDPETNRAYPDANTDGSTASERALQRLVNNNIITREEADKRIAGSIHTYQVLDQFGRPTEDTFRIVDDITGISRVVKAAPDLLPDLQAISENPQQQHIERGGAVYQYPGVNTMFKRSSKWGNYSAMVNAAAEKYNIPRDLLAAQMFAENSAFDPQAVSPKGAQGLAQLMPGTAEMLGVDPFDPAQAIDGQARKMRQLLDMFDGNVVLALAGYNWGENRATLREMAATGNIDIRRFPAETQDYLVKILGRPGQKKGAQPEQIILNPAKGDNPSTIGLYSADPYMQPSRAGISTLPNPVDMFDASGAVGMIEEFAGGIGGLIDEDYASEEAAPQRQAMRQFRAAVQALKQSRQFASEAQSIQSLAASLGPFTNRKQNIQTAIDTLNYIVNLKQQALDLFKDQTRSVDVRKQADEDIQRLNGILATLPTLSALEDRMAEINEGTAPEASTVGAGFREGQERGGSLIENLNNLLPSGRPEGMPVRTKRGTRPFNQPGGRLKAISQLSVEGLEAFWAENKDQLSAEETIAFSKKIEELTGGP